MPIYEFRCNKCDKKIEILLMPGEKPQCPDCGGRDLVRLFSSFASPGLDGPSKASASCSTCPPGKSCTSCGD